jgi:hypothetical protein
MLFPTATAVLFLLVVVVVVALAKLPTVDASISLNLKSSVLSNILSPPKSGEETTDGYDEQLFHTQGATSSSTRSTSSRKRQDDKESNFLRLDLSGRAHCHLLGPSSVMGDNQNTLSTAPTTSTSTLTPLMTTRPIIQTSEGSALSVVVGADYDFSQRWYGATRLLTSLGWSRNRSKQSQSQSQSSLSTKRSTSSIMNVAADTDIGVTDNTDTSSIDNQDDGMQGSDNMYHPSAPPAFPASTAATLVVIEKPGFWSRLVPAGVKIQAEHCLQDDREFAGQVAVDWEHPAFIYGQEGRPSITARIDSAGKTEASVQVPLHQRLQVQWKVSTSNDSILQVPHHPESDGASTAAKQGSNSGDENAWWMPDVRVDALGRMESKNEAWLPSPIFGPGGRVGLRLFVSRRLNWNAMGFANDGMESQTLLKLEVQAVSGGSSRGVLQDTDTSNYLQFLQGRSITTARLETQLERPVSAARLFLLQEHALGGTAP